MSRFLRYFASKINQLREGVLFSNPRDACEKGIEFSPTLPMPPRFFRRLRGQRDQAAIEILNARKTKVKQILVDAEVLSSPVVDKIDEVTNHLELLLVVSDLFPCISKKYGEAKAQILFVQAMEPCKHSPVTKQVGLERKLT